MREGRAGWPRYAQGPVSHILLLAEALHSAVYASSSAPLRHQEVQDAKPWWNTWAGRFAGSTWSAWFSSMRPWFCHVAQNKKENFFAHFCC